MKELTKAELKEQLDEARKELITKEYQLINKKEQLEEAKKPEVKIADYVCTYDLGNNVELEIAYDMTNYQDGFIVKDGVNQWKSSDVKYWKIGTKKTFMTNHPLLFSICFTLTITLYIFCISCLAIDTKESVKNNNITITKNAGK